MVVVVDELCMWKSLLSNCVMWVHKDNACTCTHRHASESLCICVILFKLYPCFFGY